MPKGLPGVNSYSRHGIILKARRNNMRLTLQDVVKLTNISEPTIMKMERGDSVAFHLLDKYIKALGGKVEIRWEPLEKYPWRKKNPDEPA